jgi:hypothetical protein
MDTEDLLKVRERTHGHFSDVARVAQAIKTACYDPVGSGAGNGLSEVQLEALECIATKMARIVCGDSNYSDHWADIAGYARLVADHLEGPKVPRSLDPQTIVFREQGEVLWTSVVRDKTDDLVTPPAPPKMRDKPNDTCSLCGAPDGTHYGACPNKVL